MRLETRAQLLAIARGAAFLVAPIAIVFLLRLDDSVKVIVSLIAPLFAGLAAAARGPRPTLQAALAGAVGMSVLLGVSEWFAETPTEARRGSLAWGVMIAYATGVAALGGRIASRTRVEPM